MKHALLGASALVAAWLCAVPASAQWAGQCPSGTSTGAIGCEPEAVAPSLTDLIQTWQMGQAQHTRAAQLQQLINGGQDVGLQTVQPIGTVTPRSLASRFGDTIFARDYGVVADGLTSDDQALGLALAACTNIAGRLRLPLSYHGILLTGATLTGSATRVLQNCLVEGSGPPGVPPGLAATFLLTSTSVAPFIMANDFAFQDSTFYWPGQTGATFYPPLFSDAGTGSAGRGLFQNISVLNAYDAFAEAVSQYSDWGDIKFSHVNMFAARDDIRVNTTGDGLTLTDVRIDPGPWLSFCNFSCATAVGTAAQTARAIHVATSYSGGGAVNFNALNLVVVGARYGILMDANTTVGESEFDATWDAVGTFIDSSATNANWAAGNKFTGTGNCGTPGPVWGSGPAGTLVAPCFNMGTGGQLDVVGFLSEGAIGDFIDTAGASIHLSESESLNIGGDSKTSGAQYSEVNILGGTPDIRLIGDRFSGIAGSANVHGVTAGSGVHASVLQVIGNDFEYLNDDINMPAASNGYNEVVANNAFWTAGSGGLRSVNFSGGSQVAYGLNSFDLPPLAVLGGSIGTGAGINGMKSGRIYAGSGSFTSFTFRQPFVLGAPQGCLFNDANGVPLQALADGSTPAIWTVSSVGSVNLAGHFIYFNCPATE